MGIWLSWVENTFKIKICYNQPKLSKSLITVKIRITPVIFLIMICSSRNWIILNNQVIDLITYLNRNFKIRHIDSLWSLWRSILKKLTNFPATSKINIVRDTHSLRCAFVTILFLRRILLETKAVNTEEAKRNWSFLQDSNVLKTPSLQENHNQWKNKQTNKQTAE